MREIELTHKDLSGKVSDLKNENSSVMSQLGDVQTKVDFKSNSMTDTTPLVQIKTAIQTVKSDIKDYDLQLGILVGNISILLHWHPIPLMHYLDIPIMNITLHFLLSLRNSRNIH